MSFESGLRPSAEVPRVDSVRSVGGWTIELARLRFQYISSILIAVVLPVTLRWGGEIDGWLVPVQFNTAVASSIAILMGLLSLRQIGALPGTREGYYLAPVMLASFAVVLLVMLFGRIEYILLAECGGGFGLILTHGIVSSAQWHGVLTCQ